MQLYSNERLVILIDGRDLDATQRALEVRIDFRKLVEHFRRHARLIRVVYLLAFGDEDEASVRPWLDWLDYNGISVIAKPVREVIDDDGTRHLRGNMRVEMTVNAIQLADHADHIALFTGYSGFTRLVEALQQRGKRVSVMSTLMTQPPQINDMLRRQADQFVDIADLQALLINDEQMTVAQRRVPSRILEPTEPAAESSKAPEAEPARSGTAETEARKPAPTVVKRRSRKLVKPAES